MKQMAYRDLAFVTPVLRVFVTPVRAAFVTPRFTTSASFLKGAWIPSIAEEVATDTSTLRCRRVGSRR